MKRDIDKLINNSELDEDYHEYFLSFVEFKDMKYHIQEWKINYAQTFFNLMTLTPRKGMKNFYFEGVNLSPDKFEDIKNMLVYSVLGAEFQLSPKWLAQDYKGQQESKEGSEYLSRKKYYKMMDVNSIYRIWQEKTPVDPTHVEGFFK